MGGNKLGARPPLVYCFGPYKLDTARNELSKFGLRVKLERKPLQLLTALVESAGEVVTRGDLRGLLWSDDLFVDFEKGLNVAAAKLRATLNDSPEKPTFIETVPGEGYRFVADVNRVFSTVPVSEAGGKVIKDEGQTLALRSSTHSALPSNDPALLPPSTGSSLTTQSRPARRGMVFLVYVAMTVLVATWAWRKLNKPATIHGGKVMLVVLPFENLSGDPAQEYLSEGMTEELSERLGNLNPQQLGVIGRTSAMTYKLSQKTISEIGKELAVNYVLEGSVRRNANNLRITAQLVKVSDQAHLWAQNYDRDVSNLLQVEDEVALEIAQQVGVSVAVSQPVKSFPAHIPDPEAHQDYLLARYWWSRRTPAGWRNAAQYFRKAIDKDPEYAAAYAGLGECARIPREEAIAAARKAVALDPNSGETRAALGWAELYKALDVVAAQDALKSAVNLDPNYAPAHHTYSAVLGMTGRLPEAIREEEEAVQLDPLFLISRASLAGLLSASGQNERGIEALKQIFAMEPQFPKGHEVLGDIYSREGRYMEAIREYQISEEYGGDKLPGLLGYAYARAGNRAAAMKILVKLKESGEDYYDLAIIEMGLDDKDAAIQWLEREYQEHEDDDGLLGLRSEPRFDPLRSEPRFQNLLRRMRLI